MNAMKQAKNISLAYVIERLATAHYPNQPRTDYECTVAGMLNDALKTVQQGVSVPLDYDQNGYTSEWLIVDNVALELEDLESLPERLNSLRYTRLSLQATTWLREQHAQAKRDAIAFGDATEAAR